MLLVLLLLLLLQPSPPIREFIDNDDDDASDVDDAGKGGDGDFACRGRSSSDSVTPLSSNTTTNTLLQSFLRRAPFSCRRRRRRGTRFCRNRRHQYCSNQWLDGRSFQKDEQQQQKQYANNTFNIIY